MGISSAICNKMESAHLDPNGTHLLVAFSGRKSGVRSFYSGDPDVIT
jgi:hypothetical protein